MTFPGPNGGNPVLQGIDLDVQRGKVMPRAASTTARSTPPIPATVLRTTGSSA